MVDSKVWIEDKLENFEQFDLEDRNAKGSQNYLDLTTTDLDGFASWVDIESCRHYCNLGH